MDERRRAALADFVIRQLVRTPKTLRLLFLLALPLCGFGLLILAGVSLSGAARWRDTAVPMVVFMALSGGMVLGLVGAHLKVRGAARHALVHAIRTDPGQITRVVPTTLSTRAGRIPAVTFHVGAGRGTLVLMNEATREEFVRWLSQEGAEVG